MTIVVVIVIALAVVAVVALLVLMVGGNHPERPGQTLRRAGEGAHPGAYPAGVDPAEPGAEAQGSLPGDARPAPPGPRDARPGTSYENER